MCHMWLETHPAINVGANSYHQTLNISRACRRRSSDIIFLDLTPGFTGLDKDRAARRDVKHLGLDLGASYTSCFKLLLSVIAYRLYYRFREVDTLRSLSWIIYLKEYRTSVDAQVDMWLLSIFSTINHRNADKIHHEDFDWKSAEHVYAVFDVIEWYLSENSLVFCRGRLLRTNLLSLDANVV